MNASFLTVNNVSVPIVGPTGWTLSAVGRQGLIQATVRMTEAEYEAAIFGGFVRLTLATGEVVEGEGMLWSEATTDAGRVHIKFEGGHVVRGEASSDGKGIEE